MSVAPRSGVRRLASMARGRWQSWRFLRMLLACAFLALSPRPATPAPIWTEVPVLIASVAVAPPAPSARCAPRVARRALTGPAHAPRAIDGAVTPASAVEALVLVPDRYLRNCALLC